MSDTVRLPRFWLGLALSVVGAWWVGHDETIRYVIGLIFLAVGIALVASAVLRLPALGRAVIVGGLAIAVLAVGIVAPILRANAQTSSLWVAEVQGQTRLVTSDKILVLGSGGFGDLAEPPPVTVALSPADGRIVKRVGAQSDGVSGLAFTDGGDVVEIGGEGREQTIGYFTVEDDQVWSLARLVERDEVATVIAADKGYAAIRVCTPDELPSRTSCEVIGVDPSGTVAWTERLDPVLGFEPPAEHLLPDVLGTVPGTLDRLRVLDLRDGSIVKDGRDGGAERDAEAYVPTGFQTQSIGDGTAELRLGNIQVQARTDVITGFAEGSGDEWTREIPGARWISYANGGIAVESEPTGWSPFLPWQTSRATAITMLDPQTGSVTATAVVPFAPRVYPVSESTAVVTGIREGADGVNEQRLVGRR